MKKLVKYGDYSQDTWNGIIGLEDPIFKSWFEKIKPIVEGYELWIYGGILEDWLTYDIDATLIGPKDPIRVNQILNDIARISFEYGIYPDIKYSIDGKIFNWSHWELTGEYTEITYAYYKPEMWINGKHINWGEHRDGLWVGTRVWPMKKQIHKEHIYKDPIQIA